MKLKIIKARLFILSDDHTEITSKLFDLTKNDKKQILHNIRFNGSGPVHTYDDIRNTLKSVVYPDTLKKISILHNLLVSQMNGQSTISQLFFYETTLDFDALISSIENRSKANLLTLPFEKARFHLIKTAEEMSPFGKHYSPSVIKRSLDTLLSLHEVILGDHGERFNRFEDADNPNKWPHGKRDYMEGLAAAIVRLAGRNSQIRYLPQIIYNYSLANHISSELRHFTYKGEMGCIINDDTVTFRMPSPAANRVVLNIYDSMEADTPHKIELQPGEQRGVWEITLPRNEVYGKFYTYNISGQLPFLNEQYEIIDPSSKVINGKIGFNIKRQTARTQIIEIPKMKKLKVKEKHHSSIIYELHLQNITNEKDPRKALRKLIDDPQYIQHLKDQHVNVVQLNPLLNFTAHDDNYCWGYWGNGIFSALSTFWASRDDGVTAIKEVQELVNLLHKNGIRVVFDVVMHTPESYSDHDNQYHIGTLLGSLGKMAYLFEGKNMQNGSGCGNMLNTIAEVMVQHIVDGLTYLVKTFDIDGYRFDLLGMCSLESLEIVVNELKILKEDIINYGEPWVALQTILWATAKGDMKGICGYFNDDFRNALTQDFFATGTFNMDNLTKVMAGSLELHAENTSQTMNYLISHDGNTLWDQIEQSNHVSQEEEEDKHRIYRMLVSLLFVSQGNVFLMGGEEIEKSKNHIRDSYNSGIGVNGYNINPDNPGTKTTRAIHGALAAYRDEHPLFGLKTREDEQKHLEIRYGKVDNYHFHGQDGEEYFTYLLKNGHEIGDKAKQIFIVLNQYGDWRKFKLPPGKWRIVSHGMESNIPYDKAVEVEHESMVDKYSVQIFEQR
ncbi:MAG: alpha-amylase family glycosyl hydrolase [Candidatus Margulisiibacteriota bacterium]